MAVGDNQGNTYKSREGFGEAFILPGMNLGPLQYAVEAKRRMGAQKQAQKVATAQQLQEDFNKMFVNPDVWVVHDKSKQALVDELQELGTQAWSQGVNPERGTDDTSLAYQDKLREIDNFADYSTQMKDQYEKFAQIIDKNPDNYTDASKAAILNYFNTDPREISKSQTAPPLLEHKTPSFILETHDIAFAKGAAGSGKKEWEDEDIQLLADKSLDNPKVKNAIDSMINKMSPEQKAMLAEEARQNGLTPDRHLRFKTLRPHFMEETVDLDAFEKSLTPAIRTARTEDETGRSVEVKGLDNKKLDAYLRLEILPNSKYVKEGIAEGRFDDYEGAIKYNKDLIKSRTGSSYKEYRKNVTDFGGYTRNEVEDNEDQWYIDLKAGKSEAAKYLRGSLLEDGSRVTDAWLETVDTPKGKGVILSAKSVHAGNDPEKQNKVGNHVWVVQDPSGRMNTYLRMEDFDLEREGGLDEFAYYDLLTTKGTDAGSPRNLFGSLYMNAFGDNKSQRKKLYRVNQGFVPGKGQTTAPVPTEEEQSKFNELSKKPE